MRHPSSQDPRHALTRLSLLAALRWYVLGASAAPLVERFKGVALLRALLQLLEEWSYHFSSAALQNIRAIRMANVATLRVRSGLAAARRGGESAKEASSSAAEGSGRDDDEASLAKLPTLKRVSGGKVVFDYLVTPHIAHALSPTQAALALCETLSLAYKKVGELVGPAAENVAAPGAAADGASAGARPLAAGVAEGVAKLDASLADHFFGAAARHVNALGAAAIRQKLGVVDPMFSARLVLGGQQQHGGVSADVG